jgi:hypothetical protein
MDDVIKQALRVLLEDMRRTVKTEDLCLGDEAYKKAIKRIAAILRRMK